MDVETCFRVVIFGNGYSIRGLHIRNQDSAFLGSCHLTTVIGLTLDHPSFEISNPNRPVNCLCDNDCCITEFFDCEVIIDPSQEGTYEFSSTINGSVNYFDCRFRSDDGNQSKDIGLKSDYVQDFYNGYDNWIRRYYRQSDGTYRYDAASEYEDFLSDTAKFTDMRYYYGGVEAEPYVGYINFHGWIINGEFYINFGYIYEK